MALPFCVQGGGEGTPLYQGLFLRQPATQRSGVSAGGQNPDDVWFSSFLSWPPFLLSAALSSALHAFGHNSSTLEAIALCLLLLTIPELCRNRHIVFLRTIKLWFVDGTLVTCFMTPPLSGSGAFLSLRPICTAI